MEQVAEFCELWCSPNAPVTLFCQQCKTAFCKECDLKMHQGKRQKHCRHSLKHQADKQQQCTGEAATVAGSTKSTSHLLIDANEDLLFSDEKELTQFLGCGRHKKLKVVSIFGNTGDGKSHTLNHTFFDGKEVFRTSPDPRTCTVGVWAAYSDIHNAIFLDSEGLLGSSSQEDRRTRLLLKIMAISDVIVYRTRAERLHNDMFTFLGDASDAYWKYFTPELKRASDHYQLQATLSTLGPSVVIFHETQYTGLLGEGDSTRCAQEECSDGHNKQSSNCTQGRSSSASVKKVKDLTQCRDTGEGRSSGGGGTNDNKATPPMTAEELLRIRFSEVGRIPKAFSSVEYVGTRTNVPPTNFSRLVKSVTVLLKNNAVRAPRTPAIVLKALQVLNAKFNGDIACQRVSTFPDAYFSCPQVCLACRVPCELSMNHISDGNHHSIKTTRCTYSAAHDNKIYLCKTCYNRGIESVVFPKTSSNTDSRWMGLAMYAWSGYVIECKHCGVIYRSRNHWYGNKEPELEAIRTENKHVWPEDLPGGQISDNTARRLLDGVGSLAETVQSASARPTQVVGGWISGQVAPKYWVPNSDILACGDCKQEFSLSMTKHHCRACGMGFCGKCSSNNMPVPWRGWGDMHVRVCNVCYAREQKQLVNTVYHATTSEEVNGNMSTHKVTKKISYLHDVTHDADKMVGTKETTNVLPATPNEPAKNSSSGNSRDDGIVTAYRKDVMARYVGEVMQSAVGLANGVLQYSKVLVVESARPAYWEADIKIIHCHQCKIKFSPNDHRHSTKHHCRACGKGFCDMCSSHKEAVPNRGWDYPVRVCKTCSKILQQTQQ